MALLTLLICQTDLFSYPTGLYFQHRSMENTWSVGGFLRSVACESIKIYFLECIESSIKHVFINRGCYVMMKTRGIDMENLLPNSFLLARRDAFKQVSPCSNFAVPGHFHHQLIRNMTVNITISKSVDFWNPKLSSNINFTDNIFNLF